MAPKNARHINCRMSEFPHIRVELPQFGEYCSTISTRRIFHIYSHLIPNLWVAKTAGKITYHYHILCYK